MALSPQTPRSQARSADSKRGESRPRLLAAARELFVDRGYHGTRPQDIARKAGLGHGTFYLHFEDKQACFLAFVEDAHRELQSFIDSRMEGHDQLVARLEALVGAILDYETAYPGVLQAVTMNLSVIAAGEAPTFSIAEAWAQDWAHVLEQATPLRGQEALLVGHALVGALRQATAYAGAVNLDRALLVRRLGRLLAGAIQGVDTPLPSP